MAKYNYNRWVLVSYLVWNVLQGCDYGNTAGCVYGDHLLEVCRSYHFWVKVLICLRTIVPLDDGGVSAVFCPVRWQTRCHCVDYWGL